MIFFILLSIIMIVGLLGDQHKKDVVIEYLCNTDNFKKCSANNLHEYKNNNCMFIVDIKTLKDVDIIKRLDGYIIKIIESKQLNQIQYNSVLDYHLTSHIFHKKIDKLMIKYKTAYRFREYVRAYHGTLLPIVLKKQNGILI